MTFYGAEAQLPEGLSLKARLAWKYYFENGWQITAMEDEVYIVTDESTDLAYASIYPDPAELIAWLEETADAHLADEPEEFLQSFVNVPELLTCSVIEEIRKQL